MKILYQVSSVLRERCRSRKLSVAFPAREHTHPSGKLSTGYTLFYQAAGVGALQAFYDVGTLIMS